MVVLPNWEGSALCMDLRCGVLTCLPNKSPPLLSVLHQLQTPVIGSTLLHSNLVRLSLHWNYLFISLDSSFAFAIAITAVIAVSRYGSNSPTVQEDYKLGGMGICVL
jgi:hypothetical protein